MSVAVAKIAISIDSHLLEQLDAFIQKKKFKNRSQAIQSAVAQSVKKLERMRLAEECAKLDPVVEQRMAEEWQESEMKSILEG